MSTTDNLKIEARDLCEELGLSINAIEIAGSNLDDAISQGASFESGHIYQLFHALAVKYKADCARLEDLLDAIL